ncbi:3-deoxy-7-phosphoheptulonate synthase [Candidatus Vidania fulgoroideorum]
MKKMKILSINELYYNYYKGTNYKKIKQHRKDIKNIIFGKSKRFIVIIGPCSVYSIKDTIYLYNRINLMKKKFPKMFFVARIYLEKPRTIIGWKGIIYDPLLNGSCKINLGIKKSLTILKKINKINLPIATEFLSNVFYKYIKDFISLGTLGARNYQSQIHREFCSDINLPIGVKNGTCGDVNGSLNTIDAISKKQKIITINKKNNIISKNSKGNKNCFLILRGGEKKTNYKKRTVREIIKKMKLRKKKDIVNNGIIIDVSHANSKKLYFRQKKVIDSISKQIKENKRIKGIMMEVNIKKGNQEIKRGKKIKRGVSVTDGCISLKEAYICLKKLNKYL